MRVKTFSVTLTLCAAPQGSQRKTDLTLFISAECTANPLGIEAPILAERCNINPHSI